MTTAEMRPWVLMKASLAKGIADGLSREHLADAMYMDLVQRGVLPWWTHEGEEGELVATLDKADIEQHRQELRDGSAAAKAAWDARGGVPVHPRFAARNEQGPGISAEAPSGA